MRFLSDLKTPLAKSVSYDSRVCAEQSPAPGILRRAGHPRAFTACSKRRGLGAVDLDATTLEYTLRKTIERIAERIRENPSDLNELARLCGKPSSSPKNCRLQ